MCTVFNIAACWVRLCWTDVPWITWFYCCAYCTGPGPMKLSQASDFILNVKRIFGLENLQDSSNKVYNNFRQHKECLFFLNTNTSWWTRIAQLV
jgi:hypothetical protein